MYRSNVLLVMVLIVLESAVVKGQENGNDRSGQSESALDRVAELYQMASDLRRTDPEKSLFYCNQLYDLADSLNDTEALANALLLKTRIFIVQGKMDSAGIICTQAILLSDSLKDLNKLAEGKFLEAALYSMTRGPVETIDKFRSCYETYRELADSAGMANSLNAIGLSYYEMGIYDQALSNYLSALRIAEKLELTSVLGKLFLNMGTLYDSSKDPKKAKSSYLKATVYFEELNSIMNLAKAIHNLGNIYLQEKNYDSAWIMYNKGMEMNLSINYPEGIANSYIGIADISERKGDFRKAKEYLEKAKHYYSLSGHLQGVCISFINLGRAYQHVGDYKKAMTLFDSALVIATESGYIQREAEVFSNISETQELMGDYKNAYENLWKLLQLRDTILNNDKQTSMNYLQVIYEDEKKRAMILELTNENLQKDVLIEKKKRQQNTYFFTGAGILLILVFFFTYYGQRTRKNRIIAKQRIMQLEEEKKLLAARSIVEGQEEERKRIAKELHDGLGVLLSSAKMHFTNIRDKSPDTGPMIEKAAKLLEQASGDVRRISHNMMPGLLTKFGLYEAVEDLFEQVDEMEGIHARAIIEGEQARLNENTEIMLYRVIQEMVNNTLKHAGANNLSMKIAIFPNKLEIDYRDDGKGFNQEHIKSGQSMGLQSIRSRISFLGGEYRLESNPGAGVRYVIGVPL